MKNIGLMGCGTVADYGHIPVILKTPGLRLAALYDPSPERLRLIQDKYRIEHAYTDLDAFLASGLDAVTITSPAPAHADNIRQACRHRLHILCEKPLGMDEHECAEDIRLAQEAGVMLFTGFDYRFSPAALEMRRLVREGAIGRLLSLRLIYIWNCHGKYETAPDGRRTENARRQGRMLEGGPIVDCGVHQIDLARFWTGSEVVRWTEAAAWVDEYEAPDHVYLHLDHENGAHSMVEISFSYCHTCKDPDNLFTYDLIGTDGILHYDRGAKRLEHRNANGLQPLPFAPEKNFAALYTHFRDALETGSSELLPTGHDGLMAVRISRTSVDRLIAAHQAATRP